MNRTELKTFCKYAAGASRNARLRVRSRGSSASSEDWRDRHATRERARAYHLAYAFVRGVPYRAVEPVTDPDGGAPLREAAQYAGVSAEALLDWMSVPATPEMLAARNQARERFFSLKRQITGAMREQFPRKQAGT